MRRLSDKRVCSCAHRIHDTDFANHQQSEIKTVGLVSELLRLRNSNHPTSYEIQQESSSSGDRSCSGSSGSRDKGSSTTTAAAITKTRSTLAPRVWCGRFRPGWRKSNFPPNALPSLAPNLHAHSLLCCAFSKYRLGDNELNNRLPP